MLNKLTIIRERKNVIKEISELFQQKYLLQEINFQVKVINPMFTHDFERVYLDFNDKESDYYIYYSIEIFALSPLKTEDVSVFRKIIKEELLNKSYARKLRSLRFARLYETFNDIYTSHFIRDYI